MYNHPPSPLPYPQPGIVFYFSFVVVWVCVFLQLPQYSLQFPSHAYSSGIRWCLTADTTRIRTRTLGFIKGRNDYQVYLLKCLLKRVRRSFTYLSPGSHEPGTLIERWWGPMPKRKTESHQALHSDWKASCLLCHSISSSVCLTRLPPLVSISPTVAALRYPILSCKAPGIKKKNIKKVWLAWMN